MSLLAGRYELGPMLGSGGSATVYRARDTADGQDVAIKVMPPSLWSDTGDSLERFRREALSVSRLRSRHVARVHDFGRDASVGLYLVMDFIEGVPLTANAIGRPLLPHEVLRVARGLLGGLAEAHQTGLVHRDIKPSNILIPRGRHALDEPRILDFGVAQDARRRELHAAIGRSEERQGVVFGTPAYMSPEQLVDGVVGPEADVYSAGLVLFELLDVGPLFPGATMRDQIAARLHGEPSLSERVPPPLSMLLKRMLSRDRVTRFADAALALAAIGDLETAPVAVADLTQPGPEQPGPEQPGNAAGLGNEAASNAGSSAEPWGPRSSFRPEPATGGALPGLLRNARLHRLPANQVTALLETLTTLDLAMLDALARRERGSAFARIARAVALALRLELDAASLLLEPLASHDDLARAFGVSLVAPRARRATRARVDERGDTWLDAIDPDLAAMLVSFATAMTLRDDAARNESRVRRVLEGASISPTPRTTARLAQAAAASIAGALPVSSAMADMQRLRDSDPDPPPFHLLIRALLIGLVGFRADEHVARDQLERASTLAAETGNTLLEARAMVAWGGMLVEVPERVEHGLGVLERATTLLAHGDAPSLEHIAEHNRGAALVIQGRYSEAAPHLRRARDAAKGELSLEHEILSCMNEGFSHICLGEREAAARIVDELTDARLALVSPRTAAYSHIVRSMFAMLFQDVEIAHAELRRAHLKAAEAEAEGADAYLLAEALGILYASARHEDIDLLSRAAELQKLAHDRGFVSFYWFDVLRAMVEQIRDAALRTTVKATLDRLLVLFGPAN